jgi:hypothetical protein
VEHRFPWREQYLARTRLCYVDLGRLLSHAKRDRAARVPGYVQVELGDAIHLLFLESGEPVNAATLWPDRREVVPLGGLLRMLGAEIERGEGGHIAFYGVDPDQLATMFATISGAPLEWASAANGLDPLFAEIQRRRTDGVLELSGEGRSGYVCVTGGLARRCFVPERSDATSGAEALRRFVAGSNSAMKATLHPLLETLPVQAPPGLFELYATLLGEVTRRLAPHLPDDEVDALFETTRARNGAADRLAGFRRTAEGVIPGEGTASPEGLTAAVGDWISELAAAAADRTGMDPADLLLDACIPHRFALEETGLFARLPWPLAWPTPES